MRVGSTFSGVGGMDLGLERAGLPVAWQCEIDDYRRAVLSERFSGTIYDDVRDIARGKEQLGIELLCGGFPCQDVSVAGQRKGLAGARSGLFFEFARIADAIRPDWLLLENVPGLLSSNDGRDFGVILGTLAELGYGCAWRILDSQFFGVPQRRRRVFIVGHVGGRAAARRAGEVLAVGQGCERHSDEGREARSPTSVATLNGLGGGGPDDNDAQGGLLIAFHATQDPISGGVSPALSENATIGVATELGVRRLLPLECERLQGLPDYWSLVEWRGKLASDRRRYSAICDAVNANVAEWIGRRLLAVALDDDKHAPQVASAPGSDVEGAC